MEEEILKLRSEGKTYKEIIKIVGCAKSTVSYYCGKDQKEKKMNRQRARRTNIVISKSDNFKYKKQKVNGKNKPLRNRKSIVECIRKFNKRDFSINPPINSGIKSDFFYSDVIKKYGEDTVCYLSGEKINLFSNNYQFDHIVPVSRGGDNSIENLGIAHEVVNQMKGDLHVGEFIEWCKKILEHNNYKCVCSSGVEQ